MLNVSIVWTITISITFSLHLGWPTKTNKLQLHFAPLISWIYFLKIIRSNITVKAFQKDQILSHLSQWSFWTKLQYYTAYDISKKIMYYQEWKAPFVLLFSLEWKLRKIEDISFNHFFRNWWRFFSTHPNYSVPSLSLQWNVR